MDMLLNIDVPDLQRAETFYCQAFALHAGRRFGDQALELLGGPLPIYLLLKRQASAPFAGSVSTRCYVRHWSPLHLDMVVADLEAASARVLAAGAVQEEATKLTVWGKLALFSDPFGHGFCLIEFAGQGYDAIATG